MLVLPGQADARRFPTQRAGPLQCALYAQGPGRALSAPVSGSARLLALGRTRLWIPSPSSFPTNRRVYWRYSAFPPPPHTIFFKGN